MTRSDANATPSAVDDGACRHFDLLRGGHRDVGTPVVLDADDAPGAAGEIDPRVEALAAVAAHDLGGAVAPDDVGPAPESVAGDPGDADRVVMGGVVRRDL